MDNEARLAFEEMHRRLDYVEAALHEVIVSGVFSEETKKRFDNARPV